MIGDLGEALGWVSAGRQLSRGATRTADEHLQATVRDTITQGDTLCAYRPALPSLVSRRLQQARGYSWSHAGPGQRQGGTVRL